MTKVWFGHNTVWLWIFVHAGFWARGFGCVYEITSWAAISSCSVTCGDGVMNYTRLCCDKPHPQLKKECYGLEEMFMDIRSCNVPVIGNGGWSDWSSWSVCPVICEGYSNNQNRTRTCTNPEPYCNGAECSGISAEYQTCNPNCCPVNGAWSGWSAWRTCSVTCGGGSQYRKRDCTNPSPSCNGYDCPGNSTELTTCNYVCCPVDGAWSDWGLWEACPVTCGGTTNNQIRTRSCTNPTTSCGGIDCTITSGETNTSYATCNTQCCQVNGSWSDWSAWGTCSEACGGIQFWIRNCTNPSPSCNGTSCPGNYTESTSCNLVCCSGITGVQNQKTTVSVPSVLVNVAIALTVTYLNCIENIEY